MLSRGLLSRRENRAFCDESHVDFSTMFYLMRTPQTCTRSKHDDDRGYTVRVCIDASRSIQSTKTQQHTTRILRRNQHKMGDADNGLSPYSFHALLHFKPSNDVILEIYSYYSPRSFARVLHRGNRSFAGRRTGNLGWHCGQGRIQDGNCASDEIDKLPRLTLIDSYTTRISCCWVPTRVSARGLP